jgi:hypothetical protein
MDSLIFEQQRRKFMQAPPPRLPFVGFGAVFWPAFTEQKGAAS